MRRLLLAAALALTAAGPVLAAPDEAARAICRPQFTVDGQKLEAGTAFLLDPGRPDRRILLVTAQHLFGPSGGLEKDIAWDAMPAHVGAVTCGPLTDRMSGWTGGRPLALPGAEPLGEDGPFRDIAAFPVTAKASPLRLAAQAPKVGDTVWLVAQAASGAPRTQLLHRAVVTYAGADGLQYRYDVASLGLRATSGAPVINDRGEVVGINLGGGTYKGALLGMATPLPTIRRMLLEGRGR